MSDTVYLRSKSDSKARLKNKARGVLVLDPTSGAAAAAAAVAPQEVQNPPRTFREMPRGFLCALFFMYVRSFEVCLSYHSWVAGCPSHEREEGTVFFLIIFEAL